MTSTKTWLYKHDTAEANVAFQAKVKQNVRKHDNASNIKKAMAGDLALTVAERNTASEDLYGLIVDILDNDKLLTTLEQQYSDKGVEAYKYINGCWDVADDDNKMINADEAYFDIEVKGLSSDDSAEEARDKLSKMAHLRQSLRGTPYYIEDVRHSLNMIRMVRRAGSDHALEIRLLSWDEAMLKDPAKVASVLEALVRRVAEKAVKVRQDDDAWPRCCRRARSHPGGHPSRRTCASASSSAPRR